MRVAGFEQSIDVGPVVAKGAGGREEWSAQISVGTCFVDAGCDPAGASVKTRWLLRPDGARLVAVSPLEKKHGGPFPWEVADLRVAVGQRVVVATTARYAPRLPSAVATADRAAAVADRFALDGRPRYLVFLAGNKEFDTWYGGFADWAFGFAASPAESRVDAVVGVEKIEWSGLDDVLRHELTHAATLGGTSRPVYRSDRTWWLIEGIAEFAEHTGSPASRYGGAAEIRRYLREEDWNGDPQTVIARDADPRWRVTATYGISYLFLRRVADRFGQAKLVRFVDMMLRTDTVVEDAARQVLGVSWKSLRADGRRYIRDMVGA